MKQFVTWLKNAIQIKFISIVVLFTVSWFAVSLGTEWNKCVNTMSSEQLRAQVVTIAPNFRHQLRKEVIYCTATFDK